MKVKLCLFLATTAHCHDRAAIKIHITQFTLIFNKEFWAAEIQIISIVFGTNIYIYISGRWQAPAAHIFSSVHFMLALDLII